MDTQENEMPWIKRVEELMHVLEGSSISELELTEAGTEIIIRRQPGMMTVAVPAQRVTTGQIEAQVLPGRENASEKQEQGIATIAPLAGIYYSSPSPTSSPFVSVGDVVQAGQVVALIEAMKVFNEIQTEVSGRVVQLVATSGDVVQKGDALIKVQPL